jgi:hypothetical protein
MLKSRRRKHVECKGENRNAYRILAGKPVGRIPLGRLIYEYLGEDNIKSNLQEIGNELTGFIQPRTEINAGLL